MKLLRLFLILTFMAVPMTAFTAEPEAKKAKTVDELADMY
jgi:hypothetical protein